MQQDTRAKLPDFVIGSKLRQRRKVKRLSLSTVAARSGISSGQLSQIERGLSAPSLRSLRSICDALEMPMSWLFTSNGPASNGEDVIVRMAARRHLDLSPLKMSKELMTPDSCPDIQMMLIVIHPDGMSGKLPYNNMAGTKCGTVLEGTLGLEVDGRSYELMEGDSFAFDARLLHRFYCVGGETCKVIWVTTPALY